MTIQTIGIGTTANDGTGDTLRAGMTKVNANFSELSSRGVPYLAGNWFHLARAALPAAGGVFSGTIRAVTFPVDKTITISDLGAYVTTIGSAGHTVQFAIYANDPTTNRPIGAALISTGNVAVDTTNNGAAAGVVSGSGTAVQLAPGWYWMCTNSSNATAILQSSLVAWLQSIVGSSTLSDMANTASSDTLCLTYTQTYGTWPTFTNTTGMALAKSNAPFLFAKVQSAP